jgi:hypothetical protein
MIVWAQPDVGRTPWPTPGNRRTTELLSPGVTCSTHEGAVLESNVPVRMSVGTVLTTGAGDAGSTFRGPRHGTRRRMNFRSELSAAPGRGAPASRFSPVKMPSAFKPLAGASQHLSTIFRLGGTTESRTTDRIPSTVPDRRGRRLGQ